jgi:hypothetical protein
MKIIATVEKEELSQAVLRAVLNKPQFRGRFPAALEFLYDSENRELRAEVVMFQTEKAAREYAESLQTEKAA